MLQARHFTSNWNAQCTIVFFLHRKQTGVYEMTTKHESSATDNNRDDCDDEYVRKTKRSNTTATQQSQMQNLVWETDGVSQRYKFKLQQTNILHKNQNKQHLLPPNAKQQLGATSHTYRQQCLNITLKRQKR